MSSCNEKMSRLAVVLVGLVLGGCRGNAPAPPAATPSGSPDGKVLLALNHFNPQYKLDAAGRVTHLRMQWRHLPLPLLAEIGRLTELQFLDLGGTTLDDEGLSRFEGLQKLQQMCLAGTAVTEQGLGRLEKLSGLQRIWVSKDRFSEAAIEKLKAARPDLAVHLL